MGAGRVGEGQIGEAAQAQIEAARHDPRLDRAAVSPVADFFDAVGEVIRVRRFVLLGAESVARGVDDGNDRMSSQAALERRALGRAEIEGGFGWLNASTVIWLHSAVDALVERLGPTIDDVVPRIVAAQVVDKVVLENPELAARVTKGQLASIGDALTAVLLENSHYRRPAGNGARRWEEVLGLAGLTRPDRPIPTDLDRVLVEACVLRNVLVHRAGRIDEKALVECPTLRFSEGEYVRLQAAETLEIAAALIAYGSDVAYRILTRPDVGRLGDLDSWRDHQPLV